MFKIRYVLNAVTGERFYVIGAVLDEVAIDESPNGANRFILTLQSMYYSKHRKNNVVLELQSSGEHWISENLKPGDDVLVHAYLAGDTLVFAKTEEEI